MRKNAGIFHLPIIASAGRARMRGRHYQSYQIRTHETTSPHLFQTLSFKCYEHKLFLKEKPRTHVPKQLNDTSEYTKQSHHQE